MAIFTIPYGNYYPPHGEFELICIGKFAIRTWVNFTQQFGKNRQRCQKNTFTMLYGNYCYIFIENFPQKFSPCSICLGTRKSGPRKKGPREKKSLKKCSLEKWFPEIWSPEKCHSKIVLRQKNTRKFEQLFDFYRLTPLRTQKDVWRLLHGPTCTKL